MQGYCVEWRAKNEVMSGGAMKMKDGKPAAQGVCPAGGTRMFRIGKGWALYRCLPAASVYVSAVRGVRLSAASPS
jgi:hypothetical protein